MASLGDAIDFGDLTQSRWLTTATSSPTRGLWGGGLNPGPGTEYDIIDYVTIESLGDAVDFGNLQSSKRSLSSCSDSHGGLGD